MKKLTAKQRVFMLQSVNDCSNGRQIIIGWQMTVHSFVSLRYIKSVERGNYNEHYNNSSLLVILCYHSVDIQHKIVTKCVQFSAPKINLFNAFGNCQWEKATHYFS